VVRSAQAVAVNHKSAGRAKENHQRAMELLLPFVRGALPKPALEHNAAKERRSQPQAIGKADPAAWS
jgi:hypothetical protein